jgi:hypothetical protein
MANELSNTPYKLAQSKQPSKGDENNSMTIEPLEIVPKGSLKDSEGGARYQLPSDRGRVKQVTTT